MSDAPDKDATRIDKWLWAARAYKTRSIAAQACDGGKVTVNDNGAKPHKLVRPGDVVGFRTGSVDRRWRVAAIAERRGPASVAQTLYEDLAPPPPPRPAEADRTAEGWRHAEPASRRPNKRERRQLDRLKRG
jgi:ribosome-associated heat shock protein Hsp15